MDIDYFACLAQIAGEMDRARFSSEAEVHYDVIADALVWSDEYPSDIAGRCADFDCVKLLLRYRTTVLMGNPDGILEPYWDAGGRLFPNWAGFHPTRVTATDELRRFYESESTRGIRRMEALDRLCQRESRKK